MSLSTLLIPIGLYLLLALFALLIVRRYEPIRNWRAIFFTVGFSPLVILALVLGMSERIRNGQPIFPKKPEVRRPTQSLEEEFFSRH